MDDYILEFANNIEKIGKEFKKLEICSNSQCNLRDMKILEFLFEGKKTMSELADYMDLTRGSMTTAIDSLINKKYVKREYDKNDRRKVYIVLIGDGKKMVKLIFEKHIEIATKMFNILNDEERKQFSNILNKISNGLN